MKSKLYEIKDCFEDLLRKAVSIMCYVLPVKKNKITFINFNGKGLGCNPKYIAQEILNQNLDYDLVWLIKNMHEELPDQIRKVRFRTCKALYELATSKVIITNVKNELYLTKKKNQYLIQTWHGSYSSKQLEREVEEKLSPKYVKESKKNSKQTDLFLSNSKVMTNCYKDAFWCECEIMECGFPRNDIFFTEDKQAVIARVKRQLGVPQEAKMVIYAPTFRDDGNMDVYTVDCERILKLLNSKGGSWKMLIRLHPNIAEKADFFEYNEDIINASTYTDMQELLLASDILITDYSSTVFEFSAMQKASYIYATDIDEYQSIRGLKQDFFKMPFRVCKTNEELLEIMQEYSKEYAEDVAAKFNEIFGSVDNGTASKQVVARIQQVVEK